MLAFDTAGCEELGALACLVLRHPFGNERAVLDFAQNLLHLLAGFVGDKPLARAVVAVFGGVGDGVPHCGKAARVDKVNDKFHLVNALEVSHFGLVACFNQRFKACLHKLGHAAAENCLFAEEVGFRLFTEGSFQNARPACAYAACISQSDFLSLAGVVLGDCDKGRNALAFQILRTYGVAGSLGSYHDYVYVLSGLDKVEVDIQAVCKSKRLAFGHIRSDFRVVDVRADFIGNEHHYNVARLGRFGNAHNGKAVILSHFDVSAAFAQTDNHVYARIFQVHCVCMTLGAEADYCNGLAVEHFHVAISVIILFDHFYILHALFRAECFFLSPVSVGGKALWDNSFRLLSAIPRST